MIAAALSAEYPVDQGVSVVVKKLADTRVGSLRPMLLLIDGRRQLDLVDCLREPRQFAFGSQFGAAA